MVVDVHLAASDRMDGAVVLGRVTLHRLILHLRPDIEGGIVADDDLAGLVSADTDPHLWPLAQRITPHTRWSPVTTGR